MPLKLKSTVAKVTVELEMNVGSWGKDCTVEQVHRQAIEKALGRITRIVGNEPGVRIMAAPKVRAVIATEEEGK